MPPPFYDSFYRLTGSISLSPSAIFKAVTAVLATTTTLTTPKADPDFEIKLSLTNHSLVGGVPSHRLREVFNIAKTWDDLSYSYYDTDGHDLNDLGWAVRLRHKDDKDFDLVYKKRYRVTGTLDEALQQAHDEGFDLKDTNYKAEVDWSYSKQTLSFATKKRHSEQGYHHTDMPTGEVGQKWLAKCIPGKLENWDDGHGAEYMDNARMYGPVTSTMWNGDWNGLDVGIEVLPVVTPDGDNHEMFVELSFKIDDYDNAESLRDKMIKEMDKEGWLVSNNLLKTQLILGRY